MHYYLTSIVHLQCREKITIFWYFLSVMSVCCCIYVVTNANMLFLMPPFFGEVVMSQRFPVMESCGGEQVPFEVDVNKVLRTLSDQESFYFYKAIGHPIGEKADSLPDFAKKIEKIDNLSLAFHYYRGDFERWARDTLSDPGLAFRLSIRGRTTLKGEALRDFIIKQVRVRFDEFKVNIP